MNLSDYTNQIQEYYKLQLKSVKLYGYCLGWNSEIHRYDNVKQYRDDIKQQIRAMINAGEIKENISFNKAMSQLEGLPKLKIYKPKEMI